jgi:hypothetical protein
MCLQSYRNHRARQGKSGAGAEVKKATKKYKWYDRLTFVQDRGATSQFATSNIEQEEKEEREEGLSGDANSSM